MKESGLVCEGHVWCRAAQWKEQESESGGWGNSESVTGWAATLGEGPRSILSECKGHYISFWQQTFSCPLFLFSKKYIIFVAHTFLKIIAKYLRKFWDIHKQLKEMIGGHTFPHFLYVFVSERIFFFIFISLPAKTEREDIVLRKIFILGLYSFDVFNLNKQHLCFYRYHFSKVHIVN